MSKIVIRILWALLGATIVTSVFAYWAINNGWIGYMPPIEELQNPINRYATQIYSSDGKIMGTWNYNKENRILVDYSQLSPSLVQALVATEDIRFYDHSGIDFYALGRAIVKRGLLRQKSAGGGSTITQQLAKQLYSGTAHSVMERLLQKPIEWVIAVQLERNYTKDEIITMYLNYFDFLHNAVGIKTAANTYFGKDPKDLTVNEAATLVGLCKNPSYYNPVRYRERSQERRNVVLSQMVKAGYLSETDYQKYSTEPIKLNFHVSDHKDGVAVYFRDFLRRYMMAKKPERKDYPSWNMVRFHQDSINWETDPLYGWCNKNRKRNGDTYNVYTDGLKVYTTIDSRMQEYAEQAAREHIVKYLQPAFDKENRGRKSAPYSGKLSAEQVNKILMRSVRQCERYRVLKESGASDEEIKKSFNTKTEMSVFTYHGEKDTIMTPLDSIRYYKSFLRCGFMSMCPQNGHVKAYVGGLDFMHFAYDMCMEGRRQVGSTIKPFLYSLAMENGFSPCDLAPNVQETYIVGGRAWTPRNGSRARYGEMVTLKWGLQQSNNWISAYLMSKLNPQAFVTLLREYGINNPEIHPSMALCLGPCDITVGEMVSAYTTFVNHGIRTSPLFVTRIADNEGNTIVEFQPRMNEVISEESAHKMLYMLKGVVEGGTAGRLRYKYNIPGDIAGKTGTTNNNSDAWFMGITPTLVSGCWVGGEDRDIHFTMTSMGQGAAGALPVWAYYMKRVYNDKRLGYNSEAVFDLPAGYNPCQYDESGLEDVPEEDVGEIFE
ncbi:transglycosylase domain-containing protein [Prevotella sp. tf2-5]|uniref:transglycosylase domain-containing protein n=1 Tax=Prevotella sp. tf2-5 TaxID=1761889 RepID=UPI0008E59687|nr:transglycosylase domain-containing protein [Prevotella sp. tf2-5]SFO92007.1 penicillin-binding protein 1A [Prevotella sp. tf2-5]